VTNSLKSSQGNGTRYLGCELTSARSRFRRPACIPTADRLEGLHVQNLNGRIIAFSKNGNKIGHVSRIWFHLLTREIAGEGMKRKEFTGAGGKELGTVVN